MPYFTHSQELGARYTLNAGGVEAVFNDPTSPNYVGIVKEVSGLDQAEVRESAEDLVEADGGRHGAFYFGRRPITFTLSVHNVASAADRAARLDRLRRVCANGLRGDISLTWKPTWGITPDVDYVEMFTPVRLQQPIRETGKFAKEVQLSLVSEFAPLFSNAVRSASPGSYNPPGNAAPNPSFETNLSFWSLYQTGTGGTIERITTDSFRGSASARVVNGTTAATIIGIRSDRFPAGSNQLWSIRGAAKYPVVRVVTILVRAWSATTGGSLLSDTYYNTPANASLRPINTWFWTEAATVLTPAGTAALEIYVYANAAAAAEAHLFDAVQAEQKTPISDWPASASVVENRGNFPAAPVLRITGPTTTQTIVTNTTTGQTFRFKTGYTFTDEHIVDILNQDARIASTGTSVNNQIDYDNSTWPMIASGVNTFTISGGGNLVVEWRDTWA